MHTLLQNAQSLVSEHLNKMASALRGNLRDDDLKVGTVGSWFNQNGILNAHLVLLNSKTKEPIECVISLRIVDNRAEVSADVCLQDGTILYSVGEYSIEFGSDDEFLQWFDNQGKFAAESFLIHFSLPQP